MRADRLTVSIGPRGGVLAGSWPVVRVCLLALALLPVPNGSAQTTHDISPDMLLADQLILLARESSGAEDDPRPDQLIRAKVLLDLALELVPRDADVWRLRAELAQAMGDRDAQLRARKRYCALRPDDDAAQFAWIMASIRQHQTIDARIEAAEKFLDVVVADRFSAPLRSRLSSFVAQLALEKGDMDRFARLVTVAVRLDPSNQEAATMMVGSLVARGATPAKIGQALMLWVSADPMNPTARRRLAQLLFSQGAFASAAQQYETADRLDPRGGGDPIVYEWVHSLAASGQMDQAMGLLTRVESLRSSVTAAGANEQADQAQGPAPGLPLDLELLRLAMLHQSDRRARAAGSYQRIEKMMRHRTASDDASSPVADLVWIGLLLGQGQPDAQVLEQLKADRPENDPWVARITGWSLLRAGDRSAAGQVFATIQDRDPFAVLGLAQTYAKKDDPRRLEHLHAVVRMAPNLLAGMMAAHELVAQGDEPKPTEDGQVVSRWVQAWPKKLVMPDPKQDPWTSLHVRLAQREYSYLRPITATLTLRNLTDFPLSIGPGRSVPARALVSAILRQGGASMGSLEPLVVDMQTRLRLPPRGTLDVVSRLDRGPLGIVFATNPISTIGFDVNAVLGPRYDVDGRMRIEPLGATGSAHLIRRSGSLLSPGEVDRWIANLLDTDPIRQMLGAAWLLSSSTLMDDTEPAKQALTKILDALGSQYEPFSPLGRAWTVRFLPTDERGQKRFSVIHDAAHRAEEPLVRIVYAATQIKNPQSVIIDSMLRDRDPRVAQFGQALRTGLQTSAQENATVGSDAAVKGP